MDSLLNGVSVWLAYNVDTTAAFALLLAVLAGAAVLAALIAIKVHKHSAASELAHYGGKLRALNSFVCKVCLHRSYAQSHIERRYCIRCDRTFADGPKVWKFQDITSGHPPPPTAGTPRYGNLSRRADPERPRTPA